MEHTALKLSRFGTAWLSLAVFTAAALAAAPNATPAPLEPGEIYFKQPEFTAPAVSPDGKSIGFIAKNNGLPCLFKLDRATGQIQGLFSAGEGDVEAFWWVGNEHVLVCAHGEEGLEYFAQDLKNSKPRPVRALSGLRPTGIKPLPNDPDHVLALNFWNEQYLARVNLATGRSAKVESFISIPDFTVVSASGELRAKLWSFAGQWHLAWRASAKQPWHTLESSIQDLPVFVPAGIATDDRHLLVYAHDQGNTEALMLLDPDTDQRTFLAQRPERDTYELLRLGSQPAAVGVSFYNNGPEDLAFFDENAKAFFTALELSLPGLLHRVTSSSADGTVRIIEAWPPGYPSRFYLFDATQHRLSLLGDERPDMSPGSLGDVRFFSFKTRDGLAESGYVILPQRWDSPQRGRLIVMAMEAVGERARSAKEYAPHDQFFVSRGFAVAHLAVRGTAGFGRSFEKAGDYQIDGKIVQDFEDGVASLAQTGLIDPHRVALMGHHLGGLFALHTAAVSQSFQAVVARDVPFLDNATSVGWLSSSHADVPSLIQQAGGTNAAYDRIHPFQPESFVEKLSIPALLVQSNGQFSLSLSRHHKFFDVIDFDFKDGLRDGKLIKNWAYQARYFNKIADWLDKTLK